MKWMMSKKYSEFYEIKVPQGNTADAYVWYNEERMLKRDWTDTDMRDLILEASDSFREASFQIN